MNAHNDHPTFAVIPFVGEAYVEIPPDTEHTPDAIYEAAMATWEREYPPHGPRLGDLMDVQWSFMPYVSQGNVNYFDTTNEAKVDE